MMITQKFANHVGYSDVNPYEIVRVISDKTIEIREMTAERNPDWKPEWVTGGFAGHCTNQWEQLWNITPKEDGAVRRIRLSKNRCWRDADGRRYRLADAPEKFYDYNF